MSSTRLYLFIAHGSREPAAAEGFTVLLESLKKSLSPRPVKGAYLTLNEPSPPPKFTNYCTVAVVYDSSGFCHF